TGFAPPANDGKPLGSGITYNNGSVQYGGVDIGAGALFDPARSELSYLNGQADALNSQSAAEWAAHNVYGVQAGVPIRQPVSAFGPGGYQVAQNSQAA